MTDQNAKQFGLYLVTQLLMHLDTSTQKQFFAKLSSVSPDLVRGVDQNATPNLWIGTVAPRIVDYYGEAYGAGKNIRNAG